MAQEARQPQGRQAQNEEHNSDNRSESGIDGRSPAGQRRGMGAGPEDRDRRKIGRLLEGIILCFS